MKALPRLMIHRLQTLKKTLNSSPSEDNGVDRQSQAYHVEAITVVVLTRVNHKIDRVARQDVDRDLQLLQHTVRRVMTS